MAAKRIRRAVNRAARRVAELTSGETWRPVGHQDGLLRERNQRVMFADMDMLTKFLAALNVLNQGSGLWVSWRNSNTLLTDLNEAASTIAHTAPIDRSEISVDGQWPHPGDSGIGMTWKVTLSTSRLERFPRVFVAGSDSAARGFADKLAAEVERFTIPARRVAIDSPLVEPITLEAASQRAHDATVARTAARAGAWWGALAGAAIAVCVEIVRALLA